MEDRSIIEDPSRLEVEREAEEGGGRSRREDEEEGGRGGGGKRTRKRRRRRRTREEGGRDVFGRSGDPTATSGSRPHSGPLQQRHRFLTVPGRDGEE